MTQSLMDRARQASMPEEGAGTPSDFTVAEPSGLPDIEYTGPIATVEQVSVPVAFARVMADVQSIAKKDERSDSGGRYNFRGVDRVVNAVGPALRRHGVLCLPVRVYDVEYREAKTSGGKTIQEVTLKVQWMVLGPLGDQLPQLLESAGQATDTADKGTSKAISVAQRVLFLASLHIPTQDPDIDAGHERGERPKPRAADYVDEILNPRTSLSRLLRIKQEFAQHGIGGDVVALPGGGEVKVGNLLWQVGKEREDASKAAKAAIEAPADEWPAVPPIGGAE